jgi:ParB-like chromosome segregation protein Spo0J
MPKSRAKLREEQPFKIPPELERLMVPIDTVSTLAGNARRGDIEAIKESIRANGLYRAPVARKESGEILVNNHTYLAATELGATSPATTRASWPRS